MIFYIFCMGAVLLRIGGLSFSLKVIVVTPTFYHDEEDKNTHDESRCENFRKELRRDLIPAVENKYATYASGDVSEENLIRTREHRAFDEHKDIMGKAVEKSSFLEKGKNYIMPFRYSSRNKVIKI